MGIEQFKHKNKHKQLYRNFTKNKNTMDRCAKCKRKQLGILEIEILKSHFFTKIIRKKKNLCSMMKAIFLEVKILGYFLKINVVIKKS